MSTLRFTLRDDNRARMLQQLGIFDSPPEEKFDRIVRLACRLTHAPIGLVSLADTNRMWFKSCVGIETTELPHELAFCTHALASSETLVIEDASADARFASNPLVSGPEHIRFYAGAHLRTAEGVVLGTLCVLDRQPKRLDAIDIAALEDLAHSVIAELDLRRLSAKLERELDEQLRLSAKLGETQHRLEDFLSVTSDMLWETDAGLKFVYGGGGEIEGLRFAEFRGRSLAEAMTAFSLTDDAADLDRRLDLQEPFHLVQLGRENPDGSEVWIESSGKPIYYDGQFAGYRGVTRDISSRKAAERQIRRLAEQDPLTGVANRRAFQRRLEDSFAHCKSMRENTAVLLLDIDHFKQVNDRYGHGIGDQVIRAVGQRLASVVRDSDVVARLGGDEFAVILPAIDRAKAEDIARRIVLAMREPVPAPGGNLRFSVSVGAVIVSDKVAVPDEALKLADSALYQAKHSGRGRYAFFDLAA